MHNYNERQFLIIIIYNSEMAQFLHIRVAKVQILHNNGIQQSYYSITHRDKQYFSSVFTRDNIDISDDMLIQLEDNSLPQNLTLQRWQNCMVVFNFDLDASQLRNRNLVKKKMETRQQEMLHLQMHIYNKKDIFFTDKYVDSISQHYLVVQDLYNCKEQSAVRAYNTLTYFTIQTKTSTYYLPVRGAIVVIKIPDFIEISTYVNNHFNGKSKQIDQAKLQNNQEIDIEKDGKTTGRVKLKIKWGVNLHRFRMDQNVLVQANQLLLYDFQIKFDNTADAIGCKLKIQHGSKAFDFTQDVDHSKVTKIKKIIYFIIKSENQEVDLLLHRNGKIFSSCRISSSEILQNSLAIIKKKWIDPNNPAKVYGYIKLRAERGKNVSIPQSNKYWRQALKRKQTLTNMLISLHQISAYLSSNQQIALVAKVQNQQKILKPLNNLNFYNQDDEPNQQILQFAIKGQQSLYLIVKSDLKSNDFCGIGVLNTTELRLGMNACQVGFFKNQQKAGTINLIINKMVFWPFLKPVMQSQLPHQPLPSQQIDLFLSKIIFTPYFYTYKYDNKRQVYCIVQVNKIKKVLILQNVQHDQLNFTSATGSDLLNYIVQQPQAIRIKLTFIVSDLGHEEEIYGTTICKFRAIDLQQKQIKFKNVQIKNDYSVNLGLVSLQVFRAATPKNTSKPIQKQPQPQKKSIGSFELSQTSFNTNVLSNNKESPSRRYSGSYINSSKPIIRDFLKKNTHPSKGNQIKLPIIKEKKGKNNFQDLVQLMKVRKRGHGGFYEENGSSAQQKIQQKQRRRQRQSYDLKRIEQSNPNLDRNLQMLFPNKKPSDRPQQFGRSKQQDYQQRLKGLRSVMNQMQDIGQVEPSIRQSHHNQQLQQNNENTNEQVKFENMQRENEAQWQGNQFV